MFTQLREREISMILNCFINSRYAFAGKIYKNTMQFLEAYNIELNDLLDKK